LIKGKKNRTQTVLLENMTSSKIPVTSGVPQGTVLGPILFLYTLATTVIQAVDEDSR
jgi:hypothetical protein